VRKPKSNTHFDLLAEFEAVRKTLLEKRYQALHDKPLAFFALPTDRSLPYAFLDRPLRDLLASPFDEVCATRGVGRKKIKSLVQLLLRASQYAAQPEPAPPESELLAGLPDVPPIVTETTWAQWRDTIRRHGLSDEPLGRYAPSLDNLPRTIWSTPLGAYVDQSLADVRAMKTHGEKRVQAITEVFGSLHRVLTRIEAEPHLGVQLSCRSVCDIERWLERTLAGTNAPSCQELETGLLEPLLRQLRIDAGEVVVGLAENRLRPFELRDGIGDLASRLELSAARVYQLFDDISAIMQIRWPAGSVQMARLASMVASLPSERGTRQLLRATVDLFFSAKQPVDRTTSISAGDGMI
jgi:hypothetical protein